MPISKVLMIETKSKIFYDDSFDATEKFIDKRFLPNNIRQIIQQRIVVYLHVV